MMNREEYRFKITREIFSFAADKKILIYGTAKNAQFLINTLRDYNIVGALDAYKVEGDVAGVPIITWDDVDVDTADILIIAARSEVQREIFHRIKHYAVLKALKIYNLVGHEYTKDSYFSDYETEEMVEVNISYEDLIREIDSHDDISFDLYDTLIMRRTLEPTDIFDIVGKKAEKYGIKADDFKKNRRAAELEAEGKDIYHIYDILKQRLNISDEQAKNLVKEEIRCEKNCTVARAKMVEAFNYAKNAGKRVSIISNMYLPSHIIKDILESKGITGYDSLLISCEKGCFKSNGLYDVYLKDCIGMSCLHIGDNPYEDGVSAKKAGIDTFGIKSGLEMLKMSKLSPLMNYAQGISNRLLIGFMAAELFNSPFVLEGCYGYVKVSSMKSFTGTFIAPIVTGYMQNLIEYIKDNRFDGIIFPSRDGYIFNELYNYIKEQLYSEDGDKQNNTLPDCYYLVTSRKIASCVSIFNEEDIKDIELRLDCDEDRRKFWQELMGFNSEEVSDIIREAKEKREDYTAYMKTLGIDTGKKYLFCDLISRGTSQIALNRLFKEGLKGYYLCRLPECCDLGGDVDGVCNETGRGNLSLYTDFLEAFITAPTPSAVSVTAEADVTYKEEYRSREELFVLSKNQETIINNFKLFYGCIKDIRNVQPVCSDMIEMITGMISACIPQGEVKDFLNTESTDSVLDEHFNIMRRIYH